MVWACNIPWLSSDVQMAPLARLHDGCADLVIVQRASRAELLDAFVRADEARYRVFNQFYRTVEVLRAIGMSDREIRRILSASSPSFVKQAPPSP